MKNVNAYLIALCTSLFLFSSTVAKSEPFQMLTEEYPPFNFAHDEKVYGLVTEVVKEMAKRINQPVAIEMMPWNQAYANIQSGAYLAVFSMTRTEARENLFKWVGPVATNKWVFFAKKGSDVTIHSLDDASEVGRIGTYKDDAAEAFLTEQGFANLDPVLDDKLNVPKLVDGRIDLWIVGELKGVFMANKDNVADQIEKVFEVKETQLYIAFSTNIPDDIVAKWQAALDAMKADGTYDAIAKEYL